MQGPCFHAGVDDASNTSLQGGNERVEARYQRLHSFLDSLRSAKLLAFHGAQNIRGPWHFLGLVKPDQTEAHPLNDPRPYKTIRSMVQMIFKALPKKPQEGLLHRVRLTLPSDRLCAFPAHQRYSHESHHGPAICSMHLLQAIAPRGTRGLKIQLSLYSAH